MDAAALQRRGYSIAALRALARQRLPRMLFDMVDGAAGDEITMRRNEAALAVDRARAEDCWPARRTRDQIGRALRRQAALAGHHRADRPRRIPVAARRARRGARGGAVRNDLLDQPRLDRDHRRDRRGDHRPEVDAGLPLQGSRHHRRIRRARRGRRDIKALVLTVDNQVTAGPGPRRAERPDLSAALGPRSLLDFARHPGWLWRMRETPSPTFVNYGARASIGAFGPLMAEQLDPDGRLARRRMAAPAMARAAGDQGPPASR